MAKNKNGLILFEGPSAIDGQPIVVVITGLKKASANAKTGDMLQTFILRQDQSPIDAIKTGADVSICGECPHRGIDGKGRTCYVNVGHGPRAVWACWQRGGYDRFDLQTHVDLIRGRFVRFGTYGDPAAAPLSIWETLRDFADGHTGYTHQWTTGAEPILSVCMASVDSEAQAVKLAGKARYFRVATDAAKLPGEVTCPASEEAGKKLVCAECRACEGSTGRRGSIVIRAHGTGASEKNITNLIARVA